MQSPPQIGNKTRINGQPTGSPVRFTTANTKPVVVSMQIMAFANILIGEHSSVPPKGREFYNETTGIDLQKYSWTCTEEICKR